MPIYGVEMNVLGCFTFFTTINAVLLIAKEGGKDCGVDQRHKRSESNRYMSNEYPNKVNTNCSSTSSCTELPPECVDCKWKQIYKNCSYGKKVNVTCEPIDKSRQALCRNTFTREVTCQFCYQTETWEHDCEVDKRKECRVTDAPKKYVVSNCTVKSDIFCIGERSFNKRVECNWTSGYRWSTALGLSIVLGGFGADRFYLGRWQEGIGKLFSFGGLGVWTLIDIILIAIRYLGPADGSVYID